MSVTTLTATDPTTQLPGSQKTTAKNEMGQDAFLKLLVAQLQNQDPTGEGQDPNQMVQQLTSYSSLEQATKTNTLLSAIQGQNNGLAQFQAASLVGRTVKVVGSGFSLQDGKASMAFNLAADAKVVLTVKDANGKVITTLDQGQLNKGVHNLAWDGTDSNGVKVADGTYSVSVSAKDPGTDKAVDYSTAFLMKVSSVSFLNGQILLQSGSASFLLSDVLEVAA
ncbi:MAG TPA: FlgD immunoglobulin-like domain containing protein [Holophagaceae bacterium]|nr:FlgD immunoglobulin-like domain containing protein [Holophagaceae bacterium]